MVRTVAVIGDGPAALHFARELSRQETSIQIDLFGYGPAASRSTASTEGSHFGAGVVVEDEVAREFPEPFLLPDSAVRRWNRILVRIGEAEIWSGGHDIVGVGRQVLVSRLATLVTDHPQIRLLPAASYRPDGYDLVVAADGAGSQSRERGKFGTTVTEGANLYQWLSTPARLPAMFWVLHRPEGPLIVHAYPHAPDRSTMVVEAAPDVLGGIGLLDIGREAGERLLAWLFADLLQGAEVVAHTFPWQPFRTVHNARWWSGRTVLIGDAAHTVHYSIGSGVALALADARCLAGAVASGVPEDYERVRRPVVAAAQQDARASQGWFEQLARRGSVEGYRTVFGLRTRRDVNSFETLRRRDPQFIAAVRAELANSVGFDGSDHDEPEPIDLPISVGSVRLPGRLITVADAAVALSPPGVPAASLRRQDGRLVGHLLEIEPDASALEAVPRRRPGVAVGALVVEPAPVRRVYDFVVVPSQPGGERVLRTQWADEVRHRYGLPVLLFSREPMSRDEVNTLIAAGRIDLYAVVPHLFDASGQCRW